MLGVTPAASATACWACGHDAPPTDFWVAGAWRGCLVCGLVFREADGQAVAETYDAAYFTRYRGGDYVTTEAARRRESRRRLDLISQHVTPSRLLDVGSAAGFFVDEARRGGWDAIGLEPSAAMSALSRERLGVRVRQGTAADLTPEDGRFDAMTLFHVLEHIEAPLTDLTTLLGSLEPGGLVVIEVPNARSWTARRARAGWGPLEPDVHLGQWGPESLRALLGRAGLRVEDLRTVPFSWYWTPGVGRLARHVKAELRARRPARVPHPSGHELLQAVARKPSAA